MAQKREASSTNTIQALAGGHRQLALEVCVDEGKANEPPGGEARDGVAVELASKAGLAHSIGSMLRADPEALDELLADC